MSAENYAVHSVTAEAVMRDDLLATIRATMQVMAERYKREVAEPLETGWSGLRHALQRWQPNDVLLSARNRSAKVRWRFQYWDDNGEQTLGIASSIALPETAEGDEMKVAIQQLNTPSLSKKAPEPLRTLGLRPRKDLTTGRYSFASEELLSQLGEMLPQHMNKIEVGGSAIALTTIRSLSDDEYFYDETAMLSYSKSGYLRNGESHPADYEATRFAEGGMISADLIYDSFEERFIKQSIDEANLPALNAVLAVLEQETTARCLDLRSMSEVAAGS